MWPHGKCAACSKETTWILDPDSTHQWPALAELHGDGMRTCYEYGLGKEKLSIITTSATYLIRFLVIFFTLPAPARPFFLRNDDAPNPSSKS